MAENYVPFITDIKCCLKAEISCLLNLKNVEINVIKRNRKLHDGDFIVYFAASGSGTLQLHSIQSPTVNDLEREKLYKRATALLEDNKNKISLDFRGEKIEVSLSKITSGKQFNLYVNLHHKQVFKYVINEILRKPLDYGRIKIVSASKDEVKKNPILLVSGSNWEKEKKALTLHDLRTAIAYEHANQLLIANGHNVTRCIDAVDSEAAEISSQECLITCDKEEVSLSLNKYVSSSANENDSVDKDVIKLNINSYMKDKDIFQNYNIQQKQINVSPKDAVMQFLYKMERVRLLHFSHCLKLTCLHIVRNDQSYLSKIQDLTWQVLTPAKEVVNSKFLEIAPVFAQSSAENLPLFSVQEYESIRKQQAAEAFNMKYGSIHHDSKWEKYIENLTEAVIKYELLATCHNSPLKINVERPKLDTKGGVFLLYNYARLSTLLKNFESAVQENVYPNLPPIDNIDFDLLRESEEWELLFNFLLLFPSVVQDTVQNIKNHNKVIVHTHKISQFLNELCISFSSYYGRVHILCEPYPHLLPQLYARLYLMKAIQQLLLSGFSLLNVNPLDEL